MKYIITESQYRFLTEEEEDQKILKLPAIEYFGSWETMQKFLEKRGNPLYSIEGNLDLKSTSIQSLDNLVSVGGDLDLYGTKIENLGNLKEVGGYLDLMGTPIKSLGNLQSVGGDLYLEDTRLSQMYSHEEIFEMIDVGGVINF